MFCGKNLNSKPIVNRYLKGVGRVGLCCIALSVNLLVAASANAAEAISLNKAIALSLKQHPELATFTYKTEAAQALVEQAGVGTPLAVNAMVEDAFGTGSNSGIKGLQTTLSISWLLEDDIIRSRVKLANSEVAAATIEREIKAIDIAAETASIFITILSLQEKLKLAKLAEQQARAVVKQISKKVSAGKLFVVDELRAKAALSMFTLEVEDLAHEIAASKAQLAAQFSDSWSGENVSGTDFDVVGNLADIPSVKSLDTALAKLTSNPVFKRFLAEQETNQSAIDLAITEQDPAWHISTGIRRNEVVDDYSFTAGITIPFGTNHRNKWQIAALKAKQNQSRAESDALYQRISTQALLLTHKLKHNLHVIDGLTNQSIPYLQQASSKASEAYQLGSYRYTDLYAVQQELINAQSQLIDAYTNIQQFNIELERLTGTSVSR
ncbi:TolC family protein [Thalassotalea montiporae]